MDTGNILLLAVLLFFIIFFAVRLAIRPLINQSDDIFIDKEDMGLVYLRDMEVLNDKELEEVVKIFKNKKIHCQYQKYAMVLNELMNSGYFSYETYSNKMSKLKKYFKVN